MKIKPFKKNSDFVCFIENIDLSKSISNISANKLDQLINKYAVLVFRGQNIMMNSKLNLLNYLEKLKNQVTTQLLQK